MIAISLSPNTQGDDILLALRVLLAPWQWMRGGAIQRLEDWFTDYFGMEFAVSFDSGRSAEYAILKAAGIGLGDEVLIQAFTCVAVPNAILWNGAKPVYVDIDETGNIDPLDLEKKISKKSRAIIVQHTFGIVANMEKIQSLAKKHGLLLIEDCAHALGATRKGKKVGTFGDVAFFSFGRDKVVSSVFGGMAITNNKKLAQKIQALQQNLSYPHNQWIFSQLLHPIAFALILPLYNLFHIGKLLLFFLQKANLLSKPVSQEEKQTKKPSFYPRKLPNAQSILVLGQLAKLEAFNRNRVAIAQLYQSQLQGLPFDLPKVKDGDIILRYNIQTEKAGDLYEKMKRRGILLGRWYSNIIDPIGVDLSMCDYKMGSCPKAQAMAKYSLNLPTYPRMTIADAEKVVKTLREYDKDNHH